MSRFYVPILVTHVLVAVLGIGLIAAVAIVAATARRAGRGATEAAAALAPLLRYSAFSLAAMLVTGILLDVAARSAFGHSWWFRGSGMLLIVTGALHGLARRTVRRGLVAGGSGEMALRRVERIAYGMCVLIAAITVLMEAKPF